MPRTCKACAHGRQREITAAIIVGESYPSIGERFGLSAMAVHRHEHQHLFDVSWRRRLAQENGARAVKIQLLEGLAGPLRDAVVDRLQAVAR